METPNNNAADFLIETNRFVLGAGAEPSRDLLELLGCVTFWTIGVPTAGTFLPPPAREVALHCLDLLMGAMLSRVERDSSTCSSLLDGVLSHCEKNQPVSEKHAYALAILSLFFTETYVSDYSLDEHVAKRFCEVLNGWLQPGAPFTDVPGVGVLARHLFGESWRCLFVPDYLEHSVGHAKVGSAVFIGDLVSLQRPPFLPGLCPGQERQLSVPLPIDLEMR